MSGVCGINIPRRVDVGIMSGRKIRFSLNGVFSDGKNTFTGRQDATERGGQILWRGTVAGKLAFTPQSPEATFTLQDVTIGKQFHWERKEQETFHGALIIIPKGRELTAINRIGIEDYLVSVISSEMSAAAPPEYLRAQAVVSRSWLARILASRISGNTADIFCIMSGEKENKPDMFDYPQGKSQNIRWYENDAHTDFDVCADDHCQRYEGITRAQNPEASEAVASTRGEVLTYKGTVCDARFSKCCGGMTERFSTCWDNHDEEYLAPVLDSPDSLKGKRALPDLAKETEAKRWVLSSPEVFCNTHDGKILSQALNDYDTETKDFFRWSIVYTQEEIAHLISSKLNADFGEIKSIVPDRRGASGRLMTLHIHGARHSVTIGKELEIRRVLSPAHLKSSAFVVSPSGFSSKGVPARFRIDGAGWGHGVGMCQIGAAAMAAEGHNYKTILKHYYKNSEITQLYV